MTKAIKKETKTEKNPEDEIVSDSEIDSDWEFKPNSLETLEAVILRE